MVKEKPHSSVSLFPRYHAKFKHLIASLYVIVFETESTTLITFS